MYKVLLKVWNALLQILLIPLRGLALGFNFFVGCVSGAIVLVWIFTLHQPKLSTPSPRASMEYVSHNFDPPLTDDSLPTIALLSWSGPIGPIAEIRHKVFPQLELICQSSVRHRLKGVILEMDSSGGDEESSQCFYSLICGLKSTLKVPVYVWVKNTAASGGYWVSCAGDKIMARRFALVGSVGIYSSYENMDGLISNLGITSTRLVYSPDKGLEALPNTKETRINSLVSTGYEMFLRHVSSSRPLLTIDKLRNELGASVFLGEEALHHGYIDLIYDSKIEAIDQLAHDVDLKPGEFTLINLSPPPVSLLEEQRKRLLPALAATLLGDNHQLPIAEIDQVFKWLAKRLSNSDHETFQPS